MAWANEDAMEPADDASARSGAEPHLHCPLCSDEGLPAQVIGVDATSGLATVQVAGGRREIALDLIDDVSVGDYVLVHLDTAIAKLDAADVVRA